MATVSKGRVFVSGETVTPAKLNELVDNATVTAIQTADISDSQITTAKIADANVTTAKLASTTQQGLIPVGAVMPFATTSAPSGWLLADGSAVSRATYAALYNVIGGIYGTGDGSTTFNLPDLRGIFVRGSGAQAISGLTYSATLGNKQQDDLKAHTHTVLDDALGGSSSPGGSTTILVGFGGVTTRTTSSTGGTETRPANIALLYCIKF